MTDDEEVRLPLRVFEIKLPMRLKTSSKKQQALNLNVYRNLHHRSLHVQKKKFEKIATKLLAGLPPLGVITLHYAVCPKTKRRLDVMNVGTIVDKYFSDTLTELGIIEDDDYTHIPKVTVSFGGLCDKEHVLVTITEIKRRLEKPMRVLLDFEDIQKALTNYVSTLNLSNATGAKLEMLANGTFEAEVTFGLDENEPNYDPIALNTEKHNAPPLKEEPKPARRKRRTKAEMAADAAKEAANVDEAAATGPNSGDGGTPPTPEVATSETTTTESVEVVSSKNLFGGSENPSFATEGDTADEAVADTPPEPVVAKKGSIFDG